MIYSDDIKLMTKLAKEQGYEIHQDGDKIYFINPDYMYYDVPRNKNGKPDMRYSLNKRNKLLGLDPDSLKYED